MYSKIEQNYLEHIAVFWANLSRLNNLMIILNISMFFLSGLVSTGYYYTFYSTGCCFAVAVLTIVPLRSIAKLWFYLSNVALELVGIYFLATSIVYWVRNGASVGLQ